MDIQGAEMLALMGMKKILKNNPGIIFLTELWPYGIEKSGFSPMDFFNFFFENGFKVFSIEGKNMTPIDKDYILFTKYRPNDYVNLLCKR